MKRRKEGRDIRENLEADAKRGKKKQQENEKREGKGGEPQKWKNPSGRVKPMIGRIEKWTDNKRRSGNLRKIEKRRRKRGATPIDGKIDETLQVPEGGRKVNELQTSGKRGEQ